MQSTTMYVWIFTLSHGDNKSCNNRKTKQKKIQIVMCCCRCQVNQVEWLSTATVRHSMNFCHFIFSSSNWVFCWLIWRNLRSVLIRLQCCSFSRSISVLLFWWHKFPHKYCWRFVQFGYFFSIFFKFVKFFQNLAFFSSNEMKHIKY